jgi:hypothetical protein
MSFRHVLLLSALTFGLAGCGGSKLVRNAKPPVLGQPLVQAVDPALAAQLDWVIVRNGPGAWAKNADWDEYLIRVRNRGDSELRITGVSVVDSLGTVLAPATDRRKLVAASKDSVRRYKGSGLKVKAGLGGGTILAAGLGVSFGAGGAVASGGAMLSGLAGAALFTMMAPGFGVAGIVRAVHNSQVNSEIGRRQTSLPVTEPARGEQQLDLFFPLAPSPRRIEITYVDASGEHQLLLDTHQALAGLHLGPAPAAAVGAGQK